MVNVSGFPTPFWKPGDLIEAVKLEKMTEVCRRISMSPGYYSSGPLHLGVPMLGGSSSSSIGLLQPALLIKNIRGAIPHYVADPGPSYIDHGFTAECIIPLSLNEGEGSEATSLRFESVEDDEVGGSEPPQRVINGVNAMIEADLCGGTGENIHPAPEEESDPDEEWEEPPIIVLGYEVPAWDERSTESTQEDSPAFIIMQCWYPFSISYGELTEQCNGGDAIVTNIQRAFGLKLAGSSTVKKTIQNPHGFTGPEGGYVVFFRSNTCAMHVLDMECLPEET